MYIEHYYTVTHSKNKNDWKVVKENRENGSAVGQAESRETLNLSFFLIALQRSCFTQLLENPAKDNKNKLTHLSTQTYTLHPKDKNKTIMQQKILKLVVHGNRVC